MGITSTFLKMKIFKKVGLVLFFIINIFIYKLGRVHSVKEISHLYSYENRQDVINSIGKPNSIIECPIFFTDEEKKNGEEERQLLSQTSGYFSYTELIYNEYSILLDTNGVVIGCKIDENYIYFKKRR